MSVNSPKTWIILIGLRGWFKKWLEGDRMWPPCRRNWWKLLILTKQLHFLMTYIWDALNVRENRTKLLLKSREKCSNLFFLLPQPGLEKPHAKTVAWSYDMEGHARKCVSDTASCKQESGAALQSHKLLLRWSPFQETGTWISWRIVKKYAHTVSWSACTWHQVIGLTLSGQWTNLLDQSPNGQELVTDV